VATGNNSEASENADSPKTPSKGSFLLPNNPSRGILHNVLHKREEENKSKIQQLALEQMTPPLTPPLTPDGPPMPPQKDTPVTTTMPPPQSVPNFIEEMNKKDDELRLKAEEIQLKDQENRQLKAIADSRKIDYDRLRFLEAAHQDLDTKNNMLLVLEQQAQDNLLKLQDENAGLMQRVNSNSKADSIWKGLLSEKLSAIEALRATITRLTEEKDNAVKDKSGAEQTAKSYIEENGSLNHIIGEKAGQIRVLMEEAERNSRTHQEQVEKLSNAHQEEVERQSRTHQNSLAQKQLEIENLERQADYRASDHTRELQELNGQILSLQAQLETARKSDAETKTALGLQIEASKVADAQAKDALAHQAEAARVADIAARRKLENQIELTNQLEAQANQKLAQSVDAANKADAAAKKALLLREEEANSLKLACKAHEVQAAKKEEAIEELTQEIFNLRILKRHKIDDHNLKEKLSNLDSKIGQLVSRQFMGQRKSVPTGGLFKDMVANPKAFMAQPAHLRWLIKGYIWRELIASVFSQKGQLWAAGFEDQLGNLKYRFSRKFHIL
jgi:hypothetical protein